MNLDLFKQMAAAMRTRGGFDAELLQFKKGYWTAGKDGNAMDGHELVALVDELMVGWCKWEDKRPADYVIGRIADGYKPPKRGELGDTDRTQWAYDDRDPWQFGFYLPLADAKTGQAYVYVTSSRGGKDAMANLLEAFTDFREQENTDKLPLVGLANDHYPHQEYGRVEVPIFEILAWVERPPNAKQIRPPTAALPAAAPRAIEHGAGATAKKKSGDVFGDDILF